MRGGFRIQDSGFRGCCLGFLLVLVSLAPSLLAAQVPASEPQQVSRGGDVAERAIGQIRSPYCPGLMLEVCPSPEAGALRDTIREMARAGAEEDELVEWTIAKYGEEWRAVPKRSGRGIFAWVIPPLFLLAGGLFLFGRLRGSGAAAEPVDGAVVPESGISDEERARLSAALQEWEQDEEAEV